MAELSTDLKDATLAVLDQLIKHNIKGADLIKKGILIIDDIADHKDELIQIVSAIQPFIMSIWEKVKEWLKEAFAHLVSVWEWCVEVWHDIFGKSQPA